MSTTLGYSAYDAPHNGIGPFDAIFDQGLNLIHSDSIRQVDALVLWGGTDISPALYNETRYIDSGPAAPSERDLYEWHLIKEAVTYNKPIIGVCRGAQLLCAAAGGKLIQHITGHHEAHSIITAEGEITNTSSSHHQMMFPYDVSHTLLAWCDPFLSKVYKPDDVYYTALMEKHQEKEAEVVYFPELHALAIQGHPEWMMREAPFVKWCMQKVIQYCYRK